MAPIEPPINSSGDFKDKRKKARDAKKEVEAEDDDDDDEGDESGSDSDADAVVVSKVGKPSKTKKKAMKSMKTPPSMKSVKKGAAGMKKPANIKCYDEKGRSQYKIVFEGVSKLFGYKKVTKKVAWSSAVQHVKTICKANGFPVPEKFK